MQTLRDGPAVTVPLQGHWTPLTPLASPVSPAIPANQTRDLSSFQRQYPDLHHIPFILSDKADVLCIYSPL